MKVSLARIIWKWSGESRYTGALSPGLKNFCRDLSHPTDCPWVSEDCFQLIKTKRKTNNVCVSSEISILHAALMPLDGLHEKNECVHSLFEGSAYSSI